MQKHAAGILVTGATGFVGRHIVTTLLAHGYTVTALIRPENISATRATDPRLPDGCIQIPAEITDIEALLPMVAACDAVIYSAGSVRGSRLQDFQAANEDGLEAMLAAIDRAGAKLPFLLISSLAAGCPELSNYALSKFNGEQVVVTNPDLAWTIFRPPAVYGPGDKEMLPVLKMAARGWLFVPGPADQRVSLLHIQDLAGAVLAWLKNWPACVHQIYDFDDGTPNGYDWPALALAVGADKYRVIRLPRALLTGVAQFNVLLSRLFSYAPMFTPGKVRELTRERWLCKDNARFEQATGWQPLLNLHAGWQRLKATVKSTKGG